MKLIDPLEIIKDLRLGVSEIKEFFSQNAIDLFENIDGSGLTILHYAIMEQRDPKIIKFLCDNMAKVGARESKSGVTARSSALHVACIVKDIVSLRILISSGMFDINKRDEKGQTAAYICAANGAHEMLKEILLFGGSQSIVGPKNATPLCIAADRGWVKCVEILLEDSPGREIFSKFIEDGRSVIFLAAQNNHPLVLKLLLQNRNCQEFMSCGVHGNFSAVHVAAQKGHLLCLNELANYFSDIDIVDDEHYTPLHSAAYSGKVNCVNFLLRCGACPNRRTKDNLDALMLSACSSNYQCLLAVLSWEIPKYVNSYKLKEATKVARGQKILSQRRLQNGQSMDSSDEGYSRTISTLQELDTWSNSKEKTLAAAIILRDETVMKNYFQENDTIKHTDKLIHLCQKYEGKSLSLLCNRTLSLTRSALKNGYKTAKHYLFGPKFRASVPLTYWLMTHRFNLPYEMFRLIISFCGRDHFEKTPEFSGRLKRCKRSFLSNGKSTMYSRRRSKRLKFLKDAREKPRS